MERRTSAPEISRRGQSLSIVWIIQSVELTAGVFATIWEYKKVYLAWAQSPSFLVRFVSYDLVHIFYGQKRVWGWYLQSSSRFYSLVLSYAVAACHGICPSRWLSVYKFSPKNFLFLKKRCLELPLSYCVARHITCVAVYYGAFIAVGWLCVNQVQFSRKRIVVRWDLCSRAPRVENLKREFWGSDLIELRILFWGGGIPTKNY